MDAPDSSSPTVLPCLEVGSPPDEAEVCIILMHGLGADPYDFEDVGQALSAAAEPRKWRFVLPYAPTMPVTINMGMTMPAWYDILDMSTPRAVDWGTVMASAASIEALVAREKAPQVILAGFSQGAAMALHVGLRNQETIHGVLMMSGYLLESEENPAPTKNANAAGDFPIGIFHGSADPVVPVTAAHTAMEELEKNGFTPTKKVYEDLEHSVFEEELRDVFAWLSEHTGSASDD